MKKLIAVALILSFCLSLTGCSLVAIRRQNPPMETIVEQVQESDETDR